MTTQITQCAVAVCLIGTPLDGQNNDTILTGEQLGSFIDNELDNVHITGLRTVVVDPYIEQRIDAAEDLASLSTDVWLDTAPSFSCIEADVVARFLSCFVNAETAEAFLDVHAESDDEHDSHHNRNVGT
jgi:hypothetical protein